MPAIDDLISGGAIHIADRNKHEPVKTLCGQALDKESVRYLELCQNFEQTTCKVCRGIYFGEDWNGQPRVTTSEDTQSSEIKDRPQPVQNALFANLQPPINKHDTPIEPVEEGTGDGS